MARQSGNVRWYGDEVQRRTNAASRNMVRKVAFQVQGQARVNITNNGQVDTGFMRNSVYVSMRGLSNYAATDASGVYQSQKTGLAVKRGAAPEMAPPNEEDSAFVAVAAEYAIHQEIKQSFLYAALEQVANQIGGIARKAFDEELGD